MRILLAIHQYFPEHIGGTEVYTHGIAVRLKNLSYDVAVVTYIESPSADPGDFKTEEIFFEGIRIYRISYNLSVDTYPARAEYDNSFTGKHFADILQTFKPDLVHFTHLMKLSGSTMEACAVAGIPFMVTLTDFWIICPRHTLLKWDDTLCSGPEHRTYCIKCIHKTHGFFPPVVMKIPDPLLGAVTNAGCRLIKKASNLFWKDSYALFHRNDYLRKQILKAKHIICLSEFQKKFLEINEYLGDKIMVLRHGIDTSGYSPEKNEISGETITMLMVTSIVRHKGVHIAVEALMKSANQNLKLVIYGNITGQDPYVSGILKTAKQDPRIMFKGTVSQDLIGDIFKKADVFLMPVIWYENEPLVVKAAVYTGIPVMASRIGSLPELINDGQNGWLLPPGDIPAWSEAFDNLSRQSLAALKVESSQMITMNESFNETLNLYKYILE